MLYNNSFERSWCIRCDFSPCFWKVAPEPNNFCHAGSDLATGVHLGYIKVQAGSPKGRWGKAEGAVGANQLAGGVNWAALH